MSQSYPEELRRTHLGWLRALTAIPTAAGREHRVVDWIRAWVDAREGLTVRADASGNLTIERSDAPAPDRRRPLYVTAHLDHPAFVVERIIGPATVELAFRGGVRDPYFREAPIRVVTGTDRELPATIVEADTERTPFKHYVAELEGRGSTDDVEIGDIARWDLPEPEVIQEETGAVLHTPACDDLAAVAAALAALDMLREEPEASHVRLLFTRAEEIGFVGATEAMQAGTVPREARMVLLENSRSFPESPIGGGPIVRVGDRMSTFSPALTAGFAKLAESLAKEPDEHVEWGGNDARGDGSFRWQRKLMPGGACEATVYQAYGYEATCLCLPLGNYHNMANLAAVESGDEAAVAAARCASERIALDDFYNLVRLLVASGTGLREAPPLLDQIEKLHAERRFVLD